MSILYHYVYKISFSSGKVYYGMRSCRKTPEADWKYLGTPVTHKNYWENNVACKEILATFETRDRAAAIEIELIKRQWKLNKKNSLNATISGTKFNMLGAKAKPEWIKKRLQSRKKKSYSDEVRKRMSEAANIRWLDPEQRRLQSEYAKNRTPEHQEKINQALKNRVLQPGHRTAISRALTGRSNTWLHSPYLFISPEGQIFEGKNLDVFCKEHNLATGAMWSILHNPTGYYHSYKGWTTNFYNYLSLKFYGYCNQNLPKPIYLYHAKHGKQKMFSQIKFIEKWGIKNQGNFSNLVQGKLKYIEGWVLENNLNHKLYRRDVRVLVCEKSKTREEALKKIMGLEPKTKKRTILNWIYVNCPSLK